MSIFRVPFQVCFDAQGWERGQKIFFDQLALQYPQINECDLFNGTDLTHRDPGQKCSIAEEVANGREVADCTNKLQVGSLVFMNRSWKVCRKANTFFCYCFHSY